MSVVTKVGAGPKAMLTVAKGHPVSFLVTFMVLAIFIAYPLVNLANKLWKKVLPSSAGLALKNQTVGA